MKKIESKSYFDLKRIIKAWGPGEEDEQMRLDEESRMRTLQKTTTTTTARR